MNSKNIFFIGLIVAASGLISTPWALLAGLIYGLSFAHPYHLDAKKLSAFLLQASIVGLRLRAKQLTRRLGLFWFEERRLKPVWEASQPIRV